MKNFYYITNLLLLNNLFGSAVRAKRLVLLNFTVSAATALIGHGAPWISTIYLLGFFTDRRTLDIHATSTSINNLASEKPTTEKHSINICDF